MKAAIIGSGSWGTAIADLLAEKGSTVTLWARDPYVAETINKDHFNPRYLMNMPLRQEIKSTTDLTNAINGAELIVLAVPSHSMRDIVSRISADIKDDQLLVSVVKGLETDSTKRMSEVIEELIPDRSGGIGVLSGPNHAEEVGEHIPSATVVSSKDSGISRRLQDIFMTPYFRVYVNNDLVGVELGAVIKNVIAIAAGISDGLDYGDNTKASLMTRGLTEMARLGKAAGASQETFSGLSGIGDLIATCTSKHSRNRAAGEMLARGVNVSDINKEMKMVAEGVRSCKGICKMAVKLDVEMPISRAVYEVVYEGKDPRVCVQDLMKRGAANEIEEL